MNTDPLLDLGSDSEYETIDPQPDSITNTEDSGDDIAVQTSGAASTPRTSSRVIDPVYHLDQIGNLTKTINTLQESVTNLSNALTLTLNTPVSELHWQPGPSESPLPGIPGPILTTATLRQISRDEIAHELLLWSTSDDFRDIIRETVTEAFRGVARRIVREEIGRLDWGDGGTKESSEAPTPTKPSHPA